MKSERKSELRSMIRLIPDLVRASLIRQANEIEKVVASTFEFTKEFMSQLRNTPANYIEKIHEMYTAAMFKAFDAGLNAASLKKDIANQMTNFDKERLDRSIKVNVPMSYSLSQDLLASFKNSVNDYLKSSPNLPDIYAQFQKDMEAAHALGVLEFIGTLSKPEEVIPSEQIAPPAPPMADEAVINDEQPTKEVKAEAEKEVLNALEKYSKLLGPGVAEQVLRATLGLAPLGKKATASVALADMVGPYDTNALRDKVLSLVKNSKLLDSDMQSIVIDCLVAKASDLAGTDLAKLLSNRMGFEANGLVEAQNQLDMLSIELKDKVNLPGDFVFLNHNNDYCLVFAYGTDQAGELSLLSGANTVAKTKVGALPRSPQGAIEATSMKEIEELAKLPKGATYKDIKKVSSKTAAYMSSVLSDIRNSKCGIAEGGKKLKASLPEMIEAVYGTDGLDYFNHVKAKY